MPLPIIHNSRTRQRLISVTLPSLGCAAIASLVAGSLMLTTPPKHEHSELILANWSPEEVSPQPPHQPAEDSAAPEDPDSSAQPMRECVITLNSGRTITGELVYEDSRIVVIAIDGLETTFQRRNVANVVVLAPVSERYEQLRATVSDDDIESRLALVEWLRARRAYEIAINELESILILDPANSHAKLLYTWLTEYDKLTKRSGNTKKSSDEDQDNKTDSPEREYKIQRNSQPLLTDEQLNLMRVYEIDLRDPPKMRIPDEVMLQLMREHPDRFSPDEDERKESLSLPEVEKLKLLFSLRARHLYHRVEVLENPDSLQMFKEQIHSNRGWLINACATTRCHGGVDAGSFRLVNHRPNTDETAFTNLYIIERTKLSNGQPLIDFENPDRSPLLQMGMVQAKALVPHPELPRGYPGTGFRPIFRSTRDRNYQRAIDWIRSMYQPRPELNFEYQLTPEDTQPEPDQNAP
jgi:hypothetical protein